MSDSTGILLAIVNIIVYLTFEGITIAYVYAAYWGLAIRRRFVLKAYRNQALGIAAIAAYFGAINFLGNFFLVTATSSYDVVVLVALANLLGVPLALLWADSTARVARRSDPYERDSLGWSKLRYIVFGILIVSSLLALMFAPLGLADLGSYVPSLSPILNVLASIPFFGALASGGALLSVSAFRSHDRLLRRHLLWFVGFCLTLVLFLAEGIVGSLINTGFYNSTLYFISVQPAFYLGAYCLYRSARSLAPFTNHLEADLLK